MKDYPTLIIEDSDNIDNIIIKDYQLVLIEADLIKIRSGSELKNKAIYLPDFLSGKNIDEWVIVKDSEGLICAVPLVKK